jgi:hypothetical protein
MSARRFLLTATAIGLRQMSYGCLRLMSSHRDPRRRVGRDRQAIDGSWRRELLPLCFRRHMGAHRPGV